MRVFRAKREGNYFWADDWTGRNRLMGFEKFDVGRVLTVATVSQLSAQLDSKCSSDAGRDGC
jgi:hypothetical protein